MYKLCCFILLIISTHSHAQNNIYQKTINQPMDAIYNQLTQSLEKARLFVILEPNIGRNLASFKQRWGKNYNRNQLQAIRSIVFCNPWYANEVSNLDPTMLALCPLHINLYQKNNKTTLLFIRPTTINPNSPANTVLQELEDKVINLLNQNLQ